MTRHRTTQHAARIAGAVVGLLAACISAQAQNASCPLQPAGGGTVAAVIDGRSFRLDDGREIRLAGIDVPLMARAGEASAPAAQAAASALDDLLGGRAVELKVGAHETDRYGRLIAYAFLPGAQSPVQHALLTRGLARVSLGPVGQGCHAELLAQERIARTARRGLWADPLYAVRDAGRPAPISAQRGHFAVVEGKVLSVRASGGTIYMNFGRRWSKGFAVTIRKRDERAFTAAGLAPKSLEGRMVRVRGWIAQRGGPRIEAAQPGQIEIAN